jgi:hypothetical protein
MIQQISIGGTSVRNDEDGRYSVNDLHAASGGEKRHSPSYWLANQQTKELVAELETTGIPVVTKEGRRGGTFVAKELVYAYAMWISPKFHLHVIRTFDRASKSPGVITAKVTAELAIAECFARMLRPAPSSQMAMLQRIAKNNGVDSSFLPGYAIDAAPDATGGSSMPTRPISDLLKARGIGYTASAYNQLLRDAGLLEERTRRSTSKSAENGLKRFWAVSAEGLRYGKNLTSPSSPRQTQPHWYEERFNELHTLLVSRMAGKGRT